MLWEKCLRSCEQMGQWLNITLRLWGKEESWPRSRMNRGLMGLGGEADVQGRGTSRCKSLEVGKRACRQAIEEGSAQKGHVELPPRRALSAA